MTGNSKSHVRWGCHQRTGCAAHQPGLTSICRISSIRRLVPLASVTVLAILSFRVLPVYSSSSVHASPRSMGGWDEDGRTMPPMPATAAALDLILAEAGA